MNSIYDDLLRLKGIRTGGIINRSHISSNILL